VFEALRESTREAGVSLAHTVVLVPFAQAMAEAKRDWLQRWPDGLMPRFATTSEWARDCGVWPADPQDVSLEPARDQAVALTLLESLRLSRTDAQWSDYLASQVVQAAHSLVPVAMAQSPEDRAAWAQAMQEATPLDGASVARLESLVQHLALLWVGQSGFPTDVLWAPQRLAQTPCLAVVTGWGADALAQALLARWAQGGMAVRLPTPALRRDAPTLAVNWRACADAQDEAMETAACVLRRLQSGCARVALVAMDRAVMRRVLALLGQRGVPVRDETGWRLSTSRQAASVVAVLEAALPQANIDAWVDGLLHLPICPSREVHAWARHWQQQGHWLPRWGDDAPEWLRECAQALASLRQARAWSQWALDLPVVLERLGLLATLSADPAGLRVMQVLGWGQAPSTPTPQRWERMGLSAYLSWVRQALEGAPFKPQPESAAPVVVVPLAQVLVRAFDAVVISGCDANSMPAAVTPPGPWSQAQREALGLPDRVALTESFAQAWWAALAMAPADVLWRTQQGQEAVGGSHWVLRAQRQAGAGEMLQALATEVCALAPTVPKRPAPCLHEGVRVLLPERVSATRYQRLRACPYRFFALDVLGLSESPGVEELATRRDLGNWLHTVLERFHCRESDAVQANPEQAAQRLDYWAELVRQEQGWSEVAFLPFVASWPLMRDGYVAWLQAHRASGARLRYAEHKTELPAGSLRLVGQLDRVDVAPAGGAAAATVWVMDYKTERVSKAKARVKTGVEDTQLGFYVALTQALLPRIDGGEPSLSAGYLCVGDANREPDKAGTEWVGQPHAQAIAEAVVQGVQTDWAAIGSGAAMWALGESPVCDFCQARGLCRRDTWEADHG
jgi:ATP-dependent helicase/nuclease subunit B